MMYEVPSYTKVLTVGALGTENLLHGEVVVQEKVDGSLFAFGIDAEGNIGCRSHHQQLVMDGPVDMFTTAISNVKRMSDTLRKLWAENGHAPLAFYCEYLRKPKHNTLAYERVPKNNLVLFDIWSNGAIERPWRLSAFAQELGIDAIPVLYHGPVDNLDDLKPLLQTQSYLDGQTVEGIVIKNYTELIALGGRTFPLFCKWVNPAFRESNVANWAKQSNKSRLTSFLDSFRSEARWAKAVQHLREQGMLLNAPQDIGLLIKEIQRDVEEEESENIKRDLYCMFIDEIKRRATFRFPEWYKEQLAKRMSEENPQ